MHLTHETVLHAPPRETLSSNGIQVGLPVSTTHVSCGALFGIGAVTGLARWKVISSIALAWVTTLPLAAALAWTAFMVLH